MLALLVGMVRMEPPHARPMSEDQLKAFLEAVKANPSLEELCRSQAELSEDE